MTTLTTAQNEPRYFFDEPFEPAFDDLIESEPQSERGSRPAMFGLFLTLALLAVSLILLVVVSTVAFAAPSSSAPSGGASIADVSTTALSADDTAYLLTSDGIEDRVTTLWENDGKSGTASCPTGFSTTPGTLITCDGILEGERLRFTVEVASPVAGQMPWTFASWTPLGTS